MERRRTNMWITCENPASHLSKSVNKARKGMTSTTIFQNTTAHTKRKSIRHNKNQGKAYFCVHCGELSEFLHSYWYSREFWKLITKCDSLYFYKVRELVITKRDSYFITKCDKCYYKVRQVLQSVTILLQSATGITKCVDYNKVRQRDPSPKWRPKI